MGVDFTESFTKAVNEYEQAMIKEVWYAVYGSNTNKDRFIEYINNCEDNTVPMDDRTFILPFELYFASSSVRWGNKAVAFVDDNRPGKTFGRIYRIKRSQFDEIQKAEGIMYNKRVALGSIDGIPVYTFTHEIRWNKEGIPSLAYIDTIVAGLKEQYKSYSELALKVYVLKNGILTSEDKKILEYVINNEHGVSIENISKDENIPVSKVKKSVKKLVKIKLLKQDERSVREGHRLSDIKAVVYTEPDNRKLVSVIVVSL